MLPFGGLNAASGGIAVDHAGNVYVGVGDRVLELTTGAVNPISLQFRGLDGPSGVAVGADDTVYVLSSVTPNPKVLKLPPK